MKTQRIKAILMLVVFALLTSCNQQLKEESEIPKPVSSSNGTSSTAATTSGLLSLVSYNVAGLPELLSSSNPAVNTPFISRLINEYDIVNVQEDFNYHAALYADNHHPFRTATSGGVPFGDGLNTLSKYEFTDFARVKWNKCNGTDCLTPKGFTYMRIRLADGVYVDFYNAHTNAGTADADLAARRSNISQLSDFIAANSFGNAVVVMGDLNCRYTRSADNIRILSQNNGLTDAWIKLIRNNDVPGAGTEAIVCGPTPTNQCEVVDKIFYRSSKLVSLTGSGYQLNDSRFINNSGEPLSDHYPLFVKLNWQINQGLLMSNLFGGPHGKPFNDIHYITPNTSVNKISIRSGSRVDRVSLILNDGVTLTHGGNGGSEKSLTLSSGEFITSINLCAGQKDGHTRIFYVEFRTNLNRILSGGSKTSNTITYIAPSGWKITGFYGNSDNEVDKLGVIYIPR